MPYHCSGVSFPGKYAVTSGEVMSDGTVIPRFIRWSDEDDPPFPCLCTCDECGNWRGLREQIDGPVVLPVELPCARLTGHG